MNEATSIFMTMIESTLNKMIDARIEAKTGELNQRITALEEKMGSVMNCQDNDQMDNAKRIEALEKTAAMDLQSKEFFTAVAQIAEAAIDKRSTGAIDLQGEEFRNAVREIAEAAAEEAVDSHCGDYDHDDIHVDEVDEDAVDTAVRQALKCAYIALK